MEMSSRLSLVDLDVHLIILQYGEQKDIEVLHELLTLEFPDDAITLDELHEWESISYEVEELERELQWYYQGEEEIIL